MKYDISVSNRQPIGNDVKRLRKELHLSQRQFADIYGCTGGEVAEVETEYRYLPTERVKRFVIVLLACQERRFKMQKATKKELRQKITYLEAEVTKCRIVIEEKIYGLPLLDALRQALKIKRRALGITAGQIAKYSNISESSVYRTENHGNPEQVAREFEAINKIKGGEHGNCMEV